MVRGRSPLTMEGCGDSILNLCKDACSHCAHKSRSVVKCFQSCICRDSHSAQKETSVCHYDGGCAYTHLSHAHFSAHSTCTVTFARFHACHIHSWLKGDKKVLCTCVTSLHFGLSLLMILTT